MADPIQRTSNLEQGSEMTSKKLPWGWQRVTADCRMSQMELLPRSRDEILAIGKVSLDELERWRAKGWISFDASSTNVLPEPLFCEVLFIRNLVRAGLSDEQISALLSELAKPYRYDPTRTAYSFAFGWVQPPPVADPQEFDAFVREHMPRWVYEKAVRREFDALLELRDCITSTIAQIRGRMHGA